MNEADLCPEKYRLVTDLRQYDRQYKVINDGTNGDDSSERIWELCIPGKYGQIFPFGFDGSLAVTVTSPKMIAKVLALLPGCRAYGGHEVVAVFPHKPELLHKIAAVIRARRSRKGKGRKFTPEQLAAGAARLKAWRERQQKPQK